MNLSGQEERAGKTQIVSCNYVTTDLADALFKEKKSPATQYYRITGRQKGPLETTLSNSPLKQV